MIIKIEELNQKYRGLELMEASIALSADVILKLSIDAFFEFCQAHNVKTLFCDYEYYKIDEYLVTDELIERLTENKREYNYCKKWAIEENDKIAKLGFDKPKKLSLLGSFGNITVGYRECDEWLPDDILSAEEKLLEYMETHEDDLLEFYDEEDFDESVNLYEELEKALLNDKEFRYCTNKSSRILHAKSFLSKPGNKKYLKLAGKPRDKYERDYRLTQKFHNIYNEYRNKCYSLKIHVGDPLPEEDGQTDLI